MPVRPSNIQLLLLPPAQRLDTGDLRISNIFSFTGRVNKSRCNIALGGRTVPRIHFLTSDGQTVSIDTPTDVSIMEAAKANDVPGIEADCGGSMICGTCHVIVAPEWQNKLPEQNPMEADLLEYVPVPQPNTRLTCQIPVTEELDGIVLEIPELQR